MHLPLVFSRLGAGLPTGALLALLLTSSVPVTAQVLGEPEPEVEPAPAPLPADAEVPPPPPSAYGEASEPSYPAEPAPAAPPPPPSPVPGAPAAPASPAPVAASPPPRDAGPFARTRVRFSFMLGASFSNYEDYFILGAGVGYFLWDGLELGLDYEAWVGGDPTFHQLTPQLTYIFTQVRTIHPYLGIFYRHTFVDSPYIDSDSLGVRGGVAFVPGGRVYVRGGIVYEHLLDCDAVYYDCDTVYPEVGVGITL